ncbi:MAG: disulfide bond formation protein DsbB [Francisellaceae bacterium]|nr:disulfide bond formation protein DsbB [Francisellaceae bacterium]
MLNYLNFKKLNLIGFLYCLSLIGIAYALQYFYHLAPCPLCILQRIIIGTIGLFFLLAYFHNPQNKLKNVYPSILLLLNSLGLSLALRHIWLLHLPPEAAPSCTPGLEYLLNIYPAFDVLKMVIEGTGECTKVDFTFLNLSIPTWTLLGYFLLTAINLLLFKNKNQKAN